MIVLIPWNASSGCFVPVVARTGREFRNFASLWQLQERPVTWARLHLMRGVTTTERPGSVVLQTSAEQGEGGFLRSTLETLGDFAHYPLAGSCLVRPLGSTGRAGTGSTGRAGTGSPAAISSGPRAAMWWWVRAGGRWEGSRRS